MLLDNLQEFLAKHPYIKKYTIPILAIALVLYLYFSFYIVRISVEVTNSDMDLSSLSITAHPSGADKHDPRDVSVNFISILPRSHKYFEASTDEYATIDPEIHHYWLPFRYATITLQPQKATKKLSTSGGACPVITDNTVYTYRCANPQYIFSHNTEPIQWEQTYRSMLSSFTFVSPFKDGLLGVRSLGKTIAKDSLTYINPATGELKDIELPEELATNDRNIDMVLTDTTDRSSPYILLASREGQSFYLVNIDDTTIATTVPFPENTYTPRSNISCDFRNKKAACFIGDSVHSPEDTVAPGEELNPEATANPEESQIIYFDTENSETTDTIAINSLVSAIFLGNDNSTYALDAHDRLISIEGKKKKLIAREVSDVIYSSNSLMFISNSRLFAYDDGDRRSRAIYYNKLNSLSRITPVGDRTLLSLFAKDDEKNETSTNLYIFEISNQDHTPGTGRLSDILSLYKDVETVDYIEEGEKVQIALKPVAGQRPVVYYRPDGSGAITYNDDVVKKAQDEINEKIDALNINRDELDIDYYF